MSVWIEIMCDQQMPAPSNYDGLDPFCMSDAGTSEGALSDNSLEAIKRTYKIIAEDAKINGWHKTPEGWWCPNCWTQR